MQRQTADVAGMLPDELRDVFDTLAKRHHVHVLQRVLHPNGVIEYPYVSPNVAALFGEESTSDSYRLQEPEHHWIYPVDRRRFIDRLHESARTLAVFDEEVRVFARDGALRWVRSIGYPRLLSNGSVVWDGIAIDVSDHHQAIALVREAVSVVAGKREPEIDTMAQEMAEMQEQIVWLKRALENKQSSGSRPDDGGRIGKTGKAGREETTADDHDDTMDSKLTSLTARQREIISLVTQGMSNTEIADALGVTLGTTKVHLSTIFKKLGVRNRTAAARALASYERRRS